MIKLNKTSKSFGNHRILTDINVNFNEATMTAVIGESGSGKSTLLNIIGLLEEFDDGELIIDNQTVYPNTKESLLLQRSDISYLFQNFALVDNLSVTDNIKIALEYSNLSKSEMKDLIEVSLTKVGLNGFEKRIVYTLSGGEQQRVALARVLARDSKIILCDEPTGSLDDRNGKVILDLLQELKNDGKTIIIVTHDLDIANQCDRILRL